VVFHADHHEGTAISASRLDFYPIAWHGKFRKTEGSVANPLRFCMQPHVDHISPLMIGYWLLREPSTLF
jgi:hypothetical protein